MDKIIFGIMGFGKIAKVHLLAIEYANLFYDLPYEIKVKYLVGTKENYVNHLAKYTTDYNEVLNDKTVDVIDVCTPNKRHYEDVKLGILSGKNIYCEKPLCSNIEDSIKLENMIKDRNSFYNVALMYRAMPALRMAKNMIAQGLIGDTISFRGQLFHKSYLDENKCGWRLSKESGGGAALDLGVHLVDAFNFILSNEIVKSHVNLGFYFKDRMDVDDNATIILDLKSGGKGSVEVSRIYAEPEEKTIFTIYGTKGSISFDTNNPRKLSHYNFNSDTTTIIPCTHKYYPKERDSMGWFFDCHMANIVEYCDQIYYNKLSDDIATFRDGVKVQTLIL